MKIRPLGAELFDAEGHDEGHTRFSQFCERTKKLISNSVPSHLCAYSFVRSLTSACRSMWCDFARNRSNQICYCEVPLLSCAHFVHSSCCPLVTALVARSVYGLDRPRFMPGSGRALLFSTTSRPLLGPHIIARIFLDIFPEYKTEMSESHILLPSDASVKNMSWYTSTSLYVASLNSWHNSALWLPIHYSTPYSLSWRQHR